LILILGLTTEENTLAQYHLVTNQSISQLSNILLIAHAVTKKMYVANTGWVVMPGLLRQFVVT